MKTDNLKNPKYFVVLAVLIVVLATLVLNQDFEQSTLASTHQTLVDGAGSKSAGSSISHQSDRLETVALAANELNKLQVQGNGTVSPHILAELMESDEFKADMIYLENLKKSLSGDLIGQTAFQIIFQSLLSKIDQSIKPDEMYCISHKLCPVRMEDLYVESMQRLATKDFLHVKHLLLDHMIESELDTVTKQNILFSELTVENFEPTAQTLEGQQVSVSDEGLYAIGLVEKLHKIEAPGPALVGAGMQVMDSMQDPYTKGILANKLVQLHPEQVEDVTLGLSQNGFDDEQIIEILIGYSN